MDLSFFLGGFSTCNNMLDCEQLLCVLLNLSVLASDGWQCSRGGDKLVFFGEEEGQEGKGGLGCDLDGMSTF